VCVYVWVGVYAHMRVCVVRGCFGVRGAIRLCVAVSCSVLQHITVCCSVLQCDAACCSVLQCVVYWDCVHEEGGKG